MTPVRIFGWSAGEVQLPAPHHAEVKSGSTNSVEMTLYFAVDEGDEALKPVSTELQPSLARDLAIRLWLAADQTEDPTK